MGSNIDNGGAQGARADGRPQGFAPSVREQSRMATTGL
jgi:hypothetical protein